MRSSLGLAVLAAAVISSLGTVAPAAANLAHGTFATAPRPAVAGMSPAFGSRPFFRPAASHWLTPLGNPPMRPVQHRFSMPPPPCTPGNRLYFSDYSNNVIDSFNLAGGAAACTVTPGGLSAPIGIWVNPHLGAYHNMLFAANSGNDTAVAFATPISNSSLPSLQFNTLGPAGDVVQDRSGNVYVSEIGTPTIDVYKRPLTGCVYPTGCARNYTITDPCGAVYWLATDGKGDVYSNNYCGYVALFRAPITASMTGTAVAGTAFTFPGGMIVDSHFHLLVCDQGNGSSGLITNYIVNVGSYTATVNYTLAPYSGDIAGIGLPQNNTYLWGANVAPNQGQRYVNAAAGAFTLTTAIDATMTYSLGAAARPTSNDS